VAISFCRRLIQPLQDRAHPAFEYWGQSDPTQVAQRKVSKAEMMARAKKIFGGRIRNKECPRHWGYIAPPTRESSTLSLLSTWSPSSIRICSDAILVCILCSTVRAYTVTRHRCVMKTSAATRSTAWQTCRRRRLPPSRSTSPTRRSGATVRRPPRLAEALPRSPHRDVRGRPRRRKGGESRPGPRCR
jgi:hypothetical protein